MVWLPNSGNVRLLLNHEGCWASLYGWPSA